MSSYSPFLFVCNDFKEDFRVLGPKCSQPYLAMCIATVMQKTRIFYQVVKKSLIIKQKKHTIKLVNTRHSAHHSQVLIVGTATIIKS